MPLFKVGDRVQIGCGAHHTMRGVTGPVEAVEGNGVYLVARPDGYRGYVDAVDMRLAPAAPPAEDAALAWVKAYLTERQDGDWTVTRSVLGRLLEEVYGLRVTVVPPVPATIAFTPITTSEF